MSGSLPFLLPLFSLPLIVRPPAIWASRLHLSSKLLNSRKRLNRLKLNFLQVDPRLQAILLLFYRLPVHLLCHCSRSPVPKLPFYVWWLAPLAPVRILRMSPILLTSTRNPSSRGEKRKNTVSCFCDTALFGSVVSDCLVRFFTCCEISPHFSHFWLNKIYQVLARFNIRLIFMYVPSYFTMVPPCFVSCTSIFSLVAPAWAYCPARPLSPPSLRSLHLSFPFLLPLTWFLTVTSCLARLFRWLLSMFYPNFLPSVASLGIVCGSPLLATLCPFFSSSSCSTPLSALLLPFSTLIFLSSPLKVFAQSGSAQRGNTLRSHDPKWSLAAMSGAFRVGAAYDLQLSSCAFLMCRLRSRCQLCRWMLRTTCYTFVSWHSPHHFSSSL